MNNGDPMVRATQIWLNRTYGNDERFNVIPESVYGKTGWTTIYALIRALQIELGIQNTADNFGPSTVSYFNNQYPTGVHSETGVCRNIYGIIQGALWCKGYNTGHYAVLEDGEYVIQAIFDSSVESAIEQLEADAGRNTQTGVVDLNIMKALLSMDYFYTFSNTTRAIKIQQMQRYLNSKYEPYIGLSPCDGIYGRTTNKALIYAIQAEEGMTTSIANGNFGPSTRNCCPTIPYNNEQTNYYGYTYGNEKINNFIKLMNIGLYFNGIGDGTFTNGYNSNLVKQFQNKYGLVNNGICDLGTWLSICISCGDTSRNAKACDCATILTTEKAQTLYNNGYRYVGRYLSGQIPGDISKAMTISEMQIAFSNGLRIFPIFQESANTISYFTEARAVIDATSAYQHATDLGIPENTVIYFAVDCDPLETQITNAIIPYFAKIYSTMVNSFNNKYKIGIYGTRNVCDKVCKTGYALYSFVSDMSTGYSGNLGFCIPDNWAFDQFSTVTIGTGNGSIEIDKDGFSGRDFGIGSSGLSEIHKVYYNLQEIYNFAITYNNSTIEEANLLTLQYLRHLANGQYGVDDVEINDNWALMAGKIDGTFCTALDAILQNLDLNFNDPIKNINYDILHFGATLNALLYSTLDDNLSGYDNLLDNYAGWAGDLITYAISIKNNNWNQQNATNNICTNVNSYFTLSDYIADVDAVNIAHMMNNNSVLTVPEAFLTYFNQIDDITNNIYVSTRTNRFVQNIGTYNTLAQDCNSIISSTAFPYPMLRNMLLNNESNYQDELEMSEIAFLTFVANELNLE